MKQLWTVTQFEYATYIKSKSFIIMTAIMMVLGLVLPSIPSLGGMFSGGVGGLLTGGSDEGARMAVTDASGVFSADVCASYMNNYDLVFYANADEAYDAVASGDCQIGVAIADYTFSFYVPSMKLSYYTVLDQIDTMVRTEYRLARFTTAGISSDEATAILNYSPASQIVTVSTPEEDNAGNYTENIVYAYFILFLLYFSLMMFGQYVLTSVIREKTTKTMELLVISCKSDRLIHGKVLGVGLAGLTQLALLAVAAVTSMYLNAQLNANVEGAFVVAVKPDILTFMILYFLLGFFAFAYVYAALGSTVSRMEDANSVQTLPMLLIIAGFLTSMIGMMSPGAMWVTVLSYVPFFTPMVMFMRVCMGSAAMWEAWLAVGLQLAVIMLVGWLSGRIYRMGTLMYGKKLNIKDLVAAFR